MTSKHVMVDAVAASRLIRRLHLATDCSAFLLPWQQLGISYGYPSSNGLTIVTGSALAAVVHTVDTARLSISQYITDSDLRG